MSSEQFEVKKDEFQTVCDEISRRISSVGSAKGGQFQVLDRPKKVDKLQKLTFTIYGIFSVFWASQFISQYYYNVAD